MINSQQISSLPPVDDGELISAGVSSDAGPTAEELAAFEQAMNEARAKFIAAAMAEDGMPISAGWRGSEVERKLSLTTEQKEMLDHKQITNTSGSH